MISTPQRIFFTAEMWAVSFKTVVGFIHKLHFQTFGNIRQGVLIFMNNILMKQSALYHIHFFGPTVNITTLEARIVVLSGELRF